MKKLCACLLLLAIPVCSWSQEAPAPETTTGASQVSRWSLGLGVAVSDNAYVGHGTQVQPFPVVQYEGEYLFLHGINGGVHLLRTENFSVDAILSPGFNQIQASDFSRSDLAKRGINRDDLDDRDLSVDAGFAASWHGSAGRLQLEAKTDIAGSSEGAEYSLKYGYPLHLWGFRILPTVGVNFLSSKVADYYYGIHANEERRGVPGYLPGGSLVPEAGIGLIRPIGSKWSLLINAKYSQLPDKISQSPLVDGNKAGSVFVGFSRAL